MLDRWKRCEACKSKKVPGPRPGYMKPDAVACENCGAVYTVRDNLGLELEFDPSEQAPRENDPVWAY